MDTKFAVEKVGRVLVSCASAGSVTDEYVDSIVTELVGTVGHLASSLGSVTTTAVQRKKLSEKAAELGIPTAIVTDSMLSRGAVAAVGWMGYNVKAFSWTDLEDASRFAGASQAQVASVVECLMRLRKEAEKKANQPSSD